MLQPGSRTKRLALGLYTKSRVNALPFCVGAEELDASRYTTSDASCSSRKHLSTKKKSPRLEGISEIRAVSRCSLISTVAYSYERRYRLSTVLVICCGGGSSSVSDGQQHQR